MKINGIKICRDNVTSLKSFNVKPENKTPLFTKDLVKAAQIRDAAYCSAIRAKSSPLPEHATCSLEWTRFRLLRDSFKSLFRLAKSNHFKEFVENNSTSSTKLWKYLNPYRNPNKRTELNAADFNNSADNNTDQSIADLFSNFFLSILHSFVFVTLLNCIAYSTNFFNTNGQLLAFSKIKIPFKFHLISKDCVFHHLNTLNEKSAAGIEGSIIKACAHRSQFQ